jgi:hypothetical protein
MLLNRNETSHSANENAVVDLSKLPTNPAKGTPICQDKTSKVCDDVQITYQ